MWVREGLILLFWVNSTIYVFSVMYNVCEDPELECLGALKRHTC